MSLDDYSTTPANNNAAPPVGAPEGMAANAVNNTMREMMANMRGGVGLVVNTTALMTALDVAKMSDNNVISVTNRVSDGDGGGGLFFYDSASSDTANSGTIFAPDSGAGRFIRVFQGNTDVRWFGEVGSTAATNTTTFQALIDASTNGANVDLPIGSIPLNQLTLDVDTQGLTFIGSGRHSNDSTKGTTLVNNDTLPLFTTSVSGTLTNTIFRNMSFRQLNNSRGSIFDFDNSIDFTTWDDCLCTLLNPASHYINADVTSISNVNIINPRIKMAAAASVPAINIKASGSGSIFGFKVTGGRIENTDTGTAPIVKMEDATGGATSTAIEFDGTILEFPAGGGGIHMLSIRSPTFNNIFADDSTTIAAPVILLDTSAVGSSQLPFSPSFNNCTILQGDASFPDIKVIPGASGTQVKVDGGEIGFLDTGNKAAWLPGCDVGSNISTVKAVKVFSGIITLPSGHTVPESESGLSGVIVTTGTEAISFVTTFSAIPSVVVTHNAGTARNAPGSVSSVTTSGFTLLNNASASTTFYWIASN